MKRRLLAATGLLVAGTLASPLAAAPVPQVHALTGARIVTAPGQVIDHGTVVVRDGVIEAVGADIEAPADARIHDLEGLTVYPGLIDAYQAAPWPSAQAGDDEDDAPQGGHANRLVTPERDMVEHAVDDTRFSRARAAGFTTAMVAPSTGLLRGTSVVVNLGEGDVHQNLLRRGVTQNATLTTSVGDTYPGSLMGAEALLRQTVLDARWYQDAHRAYADNPAQSRPTFDRALDALKPVVNREQALVVETGDVLGTLRWAHLARELDLDLIVVGNGEEYKRLDAVAATKLVHLLPVRFPDAPDVGAEGDDLTVGLEVLRHWDRAPENPAKLLERGLTVAFTSHGNAEPKKIHDHLATAIERGLSADAALAGLTTTPAALLGIDDRAGTIAAGKMANLVVVEGDLFVAGPKIRSVWVDGKEHKVKESKPPTVEPAGTWAVHIDAGPGGQFDVTLILKGDVENTSGTIGTPAGELPLTSAETSGSVVTVEFDSTPLGMPGSIRFTLDIEGDSAKGNGTAPAGSFTVTATRTSGPPEVDR